MQGAGQRVGEAVKKRTAQIFGMNHLSSFAPIGFFGRSFSAASVTRFKRCQQPFFVYRLQIMKQYPRSLNRPCHDHLKDCVRGWK